MFHNQNSSHFEFKWVHRAMQGSASIISLSPLLSLSTSRLFPSLLSTNRCRGYVFSLSTHTRIPFRRIYPNTLIHAPSSAVEEIVETSKLDQEFVEIGYICSVHGLQGEVRVKPNTDFPDLRFGQPGRRWLRQQVLGRERIQEVELIEGRGHHSQKTWIVKFDEIDTVEEAQQLIGAAILVTKEDKPELEEGDFYSRDLIGMRVILKETGEQVGIVVNVFESGASDLLQVMLNGPSTSGSEDIASGRLVYVPFAEAIVPVVDMNKREMFITPPNGLLELNLRSDERSKKERRALEWKERKKYQKRLIAAKKKLCEMEQHDVFHGFRYGEKSQTSMLADQILSINTKLLQQALQYIKVPYQRLNLQEFIDASLIDCSSRLVIPDKQYSDSKNGELLAAISDLNEKGCMLLSKGKVAIVLQVNEFLKKTIVDKSEDCPSMVNAIFSGPLSYLKIGDRDSVPLVMVCPAHEMEALQNIFESHNHFGFDSQKVWFLEVEKLPVLGTQPEEQNKHTILMKSPWEILQTPIRSGGIFSLFSSDNLVDNLSKIGVEYFQICSTNQKHIHGDTLVGFVRSCEANIGLQIFKDTSNNDDNFNMVFSIDFMKNLTKSMEKLPFHTIPNPHTYVEKVENEWIDVVSSPNSYELQCSIYSCLSVCSSDKICVMEVNM